MKEPIIKPDTKNSLNDALTEPQHKFPRILEHAAKEEVYTFHNVNLSLSTDKDNIDVSDGVKHNG